MQLAITPFGPFVKGVIDRAQSSQSLTGLARSLKGWQFSGANKLTVCPGTRVVLTLKDDAAATVTDVCAIVPFADGALAVGHSSITDKAYLYRLNATLTGWIDSGGTPQASLTPAPVGVLWSSIPDCPEVTIAEGLGVAYICHTAALDATTLAFPMKSFDDATRAIATVTSDLDNDTSAESLYFRGCISFQQHLWAWSFGAGASAANGFRPELARFSQPDFDTSGDLFATADSITLGNRVRSLREGVIAGFVAGESLYLGSPYLITRVTGYGRSSWFKQPLDDSFGFVGAKCGVAVGDTLYYWSPRGPMRIAPQSAPDPLFDPIPNFVASVINPQTVVAGYDTQTDTVFFVCDTGAGVRTRCRFDMRRDVWVGSDEDCGIALRAMGAVAPIYAVTAAASLGPLGAPTSATTTSIGATTAIAGWTAGDPTSPTAVQIRQQGGSTWTDSATVSAGISSYTFTGLTANTAYEWRAAHVKDGATSSYLGPVAGSQFTTATSGAGLLPPTSPAAFATADDGSSPVIYTDHANVHVSWTNSGESGVDTIIEMDTDGGGYFAQQVLPPGAASGVVQVFASATYSFRMYHAKSGYTNSTTTTPVVLSIVVA